MRKKKQLKWKRDVKESSHKQTKSTLVQISPALVVHTGPGLLGVGVQALEG